MHLICSARKMQTDTAPPLFPRFAGSHWLQAYCQAVQPHLPGASSFLELSNILWSLTKFKHTPDPAWLATFEDALCNLLSSLGAGAASGADAAGAPQNSRDTYSQSPSSTMQKAPAISGRQRDSRQPAARLSSQAAPLAVSHIMYSLAILAYVPRPACTAALLSYANEHAQDLTAAAAMNVVWAAAELSLQASSCLCLASITNFIRAKRLIHVFELTCGILRLSVYPFD